MSENKTTPNEPMSDEDLLAMYAKEFGQSLKKEDSTCIGCTDKTSCKCAMETYRTNKNKNLKKDY